MFLARDPVPPKITSIARPWFGVPPKLIDK